MVKVSSARTLPPFTSRFNSAFIAFILTFLAARRRLSALDRSKHGPGTQLFASVNSYKFSGYIPKIHLESFRAKEGLQPTPIAKYQVAVLIRKNNEQDPRKYHASVLIRKILELGATSEHRDKLQNITPLSRKLSLGTNYNNLGSKPGAYSVWMLRSKD